MDEDNNHKLMTIEEQTQTIDKEDKQKQSLFSKTYFKNNIIESPQNDINNKTNDNFEKSASLLNLLSNRSHFVNPNDFKMIPEITSKGRTCSFTIRDKLLPIKNKLKKKVNFSFIPNKKEFYLTASVTPIIKKRELKKNKSNKSLNLEVNNNKRNIIDLIHEKEIQLCLDLIKILPEKIKNMKNKNKGNIKDFKKEEATNNLIRLIKTFNVDNVYTQRMLEDQALNKTIFNSEINPLNTMSISMSTNYKTNMPINNIFKFNSSNYTNNINLNTSSISLKNNSSIIKNINDSNILKNNNSIINTNLIKSKLNRSLNNKINNNSKANHHFLSKLVYDPRNEINFRTGFVRSQKKIYDDVYSKYFKNSKKNQIRINNYRRKKEEKNKLSLPEILEYRFIIKEIENRKKKAIRKSQSVLNINKEKGDLVLKDQLIEELNNIYLGQKNTFLNSIKDNFGDNEKVDPDSYKKNINENIRNINKIKRRPNSFVDGYSLFDGKINKQLKEYNYILGNKFHDREKKEEKAEKLHDIYEEYENKINNYKKELLNEKNIYKQIFIPKIDFRKDKNNTIDNDVKIGFKSYNYIDNKNNSMVTNSNNNDKIKNRPVILSSNENKKEKIYNEYINFKNEYKKKYSLD